MLGISLHAAVDWQQTASSDWMDYAADVSRRKPSLPHGGKIMKPCALAVDMVPERQADV